MTNAIEQTRREMYKWLLSVKQLADSQASSQAAEMLELCLEIHLELLRKESAHQQSRLELNESLANGFSEQVATANKINTDLIEQRDTLRNRLQAFEMASQTSAEIIKGLRAELEVAKRSVDYTIRVEATGSRINADLPMAATRAQDSTENSPSAKTDPYTLGYSSVGKCSNPFPINTIERLHWNDGFKDALADEKNQNIESGEVTHPFVTRAEFDDRIRTTCTACNQSTDEFKKTTVARQQQEGFRSGSIGSNGQAHMCCKHQYVTYPFGTISCFFCGHKP